MLQKSITAFVTVVLAASAGSAQEPNTQPPVPFFEGLGSFGRKVTTNSEQAQRYFNQGLCFLYAFNHDEALRSFNKAAELDNGCAMAWWGVAVAQGPHINFPLMTAEQSKAAWEASSQARRAIDQENAVEKQLVDALSKRYVETPPEDRKPLDQAYADALRQVWKAHPTDSDVGALFAESLMDLRPWDLWTSGGEPQPGTEEVVATLEQVLSQSADHPLALHLYVHAVEASPHPEKADKRADRLRDLQPGLGHLVHMPSHIDVRRGRWAQAITSNAKAITADRAYRQQRPTQGFYRVYMAHNYHMLAYAAIMRGQSRLALSNIQEMIQEMPVQWIKDNPPLADGFNAMPLEVLVRFGRWDEVLAAPEPPEFLPLARCLRLSARGVAHAAKGNIEQAKAEQGQFRKLAAALPEEVFFGNNKGQDLLAVADHLLAGEILYREGQVEQAIAQLKQGVEREDLLRYSEPPDWIHPLRHVLGATLLRENRTAEAEKVYRDDLKKQPDNGWSLFGLAHSLRSQGKTGEADEVEKKFNEVWRDADVAITSSCLCLPVTPR
jgi:tetratricopeptide (TPR) repeat protein